ncbi:MAG TPA: type I restriction endonuclease subunit M [Agitococcus sp.]|nr:type I restriction endonuclease subunit M [Agitococcus sp.]HMX99986.1 type I restriction endonuclease subunit M [Agitococcus sp.]HNC02273.1 type I restriction endonuclease subunit M [Agitococcus sp.]HNE92166.1 type I restriction endonuclease subunit M [Agitococcus sp.]HNL36931.1 type I restriction endonuclease subunit M [Agitococcus sp.]
MTARKKLFALGELRITPSAGYYLPAYYIQPMDLIRRHQHGDWGDICDEDAQANQQAIIHQTRIVSSYLIGNKKVLVITEADRSSTTVLLAQDY